MTGMTVGFQQFRLDGDQRVAQIDCGNYFVDST